MAAISAAPFKNSTIALRAAAGRSAAARASASD
jgi:hypothetical protein